METYGEDPYLTGQLGLACVNGLQGDHPKYLKAGACAKHYAVHSGPEELRHEFDAVTSMKDLYETYLPAFKTLVIEGDVGEWRGGLCKSTFIAGCFDGSVEFQRTHSERLLGIKGFSYRSYGD